MANHESKRPPVGAAAASEDTRSGDTSEAKNSAGGARAQDRALTELVRRVKFGPVTATFRWSRAGGLKITWDPWQPRFSSRIRADAFEAIYTAARDAFLAEVATAVGGRILLGDLQGHIKIIEPSSGTRQ